MRIRWTVIDQFLNSMLAVFCLISASIFGYWIFDYQVPVTFYSVKPEKAIFHLNELIAVDFDYSLDRYCPAMVSRYLIDDDGARIGVVSTAGLSGNILGRHHNIIKFPAPRNIKPGTYRFGSYVNYQCNLLHTIPAMSGPSEPFELVP